MGPPEEDHSSSEGEEQGSESSSTSEFVELRKERDILAAEVEKLKVQMEQAQGTCEK